MRRILTIFGALLLAMLLTLGACAPAPSLTPVPAPSAEDYLSALGGIAVTTTRYHPEVMPPPPGSKFPPTFYEPMPIGRVPPNITGSVTLRPYGQPHDELEVEPDWFREGQTVDILVEANKSVLWQLDKPDTVAIYARFGSSVSAEAIGLLDVWGFFYEDIMTEIQMEGDTPRHKYSTALRLIAWEDEYLELRFMNFSPEVVEVSYSIWRGGFVPDFINDYTRAWEKYWESGDVSEEEFLKLKWDMERYLREK